MDTTETYIKMCEGAEEIQRVWAKRNKDTDLAAHKGTHDICVILAEHFSGGETDKYIWLPRQDQLQDMVELSLDVMNYSFYVFSMAVGALNKFTSMEQLWLAFVMKEKYGKVWNGENWIG